MLRKIVFSLAVILTSHTVYADAADVSACVAMSETQPSLRQFSKQQITSYCQCMETKQDSILEQAGKVSSNKMADMMLAAAQQCMVQANMITKEQGKQAEETYKNNKKGNSTTSGTNKANTNQNNTTKSNNSSKKMPGLLTPGLK